MSTSTPEEFSFLAGEAAEFGITTALQTPRRVSATDSDGREQSAIVWGEHPTLTFLHGGGLNAHTWDATIAELGLPSVAIDLPGHGDSAWRDDLDYRPVTSAPAVASVLDDLGLSAQTVIGQSLGGGAAIALAAQRPELVSRLVIVDVSPGLRAEDAAQVTDFLAGPQLFSSREEIAEKAIAFGFGASRAALDRGVFLNTRVREDGSVIFKHHLANLNPGEVPLVHEFAPLWAALERIEIPVLLVHATRGFLREEVVEEFLRRVPGSIGVSVESGHNVQEEAPVELARIIREFLSV
jgi:pimeloyl-ACP methyl ester carboxylesterase